MESSESIRGSQERRRTRASDTSGVAKTKNHTCDRCGRQFVRLEHLQRHIRTHTKEKPFQCDVCARNFARSDLLRRHQRLVFHADDDVAILETGTTEENFLPDQHAHAAESTSIDPGLISSTAENNTHSRHDSVVGIALLEPGIDNRASASRLDLLSNAAMSHAAMSNRNEIPQTFESIVIPDGLTPSMGSFGDDMEDPLLDFTGFMDSVGLSADWQIFGLNAQSFQTPAVPISLDADDIIQSVEIHRAAEIMHDENSVQAEVGSFSRFASRLPSLQPEPRKQEEPHRIAGSPYQRSTLAVSHEERHQFINNLSDFKNVLPAEFSRPSKATISRLLSGYFNGFDDHLPFIHRSTFSVASAAPELVLALLSVGSHYKFERQKCFELFFAAKSVALEQIRRREHRWITQASPQFFDGSSNAASSSGGASAHGSSIPMPLDSSSYQYSSKAQMETVRALLLLMAFASWHGGLVREALSFQSTLARLVREDGLTADQPSGEVLTWQEWVSYEADKRTKLIVYCFFNLQSIAFHIPPLLLTEEVKLYLPSSAEEWKASNASEWSLIHRDRPQELLFQEAYIALFEKSGLPQTSSTIPPLSLYILIQGLLQHIFLTRRLSSSLPSEKRKYLRPEDISTIEHALKNWKKLWIRAPESNLALDPQNPNGPIAFTSTALLGLAYIRLQIDIGPGRYLGLHDPALTARYLHTTPAPPRSSKLIHALLHSAHALSIPVKLGINFVAETQTFFWSIQHSLCSLECAFLLSKWLFSLPHVVKSNGTASLTVHEKKLVNWVKSMLDETEFAVEDETEDEEEDDDFEVSEKPEMTRMLAIAVVRVWAKTFRGTSKWQIVDVIGRSMEIYGDLLEQDASTLSRR